MQRVPAKTWHVAGIDVAVKGNSTEKFQHGPYTLITTQSLVRYYILVYFLDGTGWTGKLMTCKALLGQTITERIARTSADRTL